MMSVNASVSASSSASQPGPLRCLLVSTQETRPAELIDELRRRGLQVKIEPEPSRVMVELARGHADVVIVNDPAGRAGFGELIDAVGTYYPQIARWQYGHDASGKRALSRVTSNGAASQDARAAGAASKAGNEDVVESTDEKAMTGEASRQHDEVSGADGQGSDARREGGDDDGGRREEDAPSPASFDPWRQERANEPLLSAEELSMLLGEPERGRERDE